MLSFTLVALVVLVGQFVLAYDAAACCKQAFGLEAVCDQQYSSNSSAAQPLYVTYDYCASQCPGIGFQLAEPNDLRQ